MKCCRTCRRRPWKDGADLNYLLPISCHPALVPIDWKNRGLDTTACGEQYYEESDAPLAGKDKLEAQKEAVRQTLPELKGNVKVTIGIVEKIDDPDRLQLLLEHEKKDKERKMVIEAIEKRIAEAEAAIELTRASQSVESPEGENAGEASDGDGSMGEEAVEGDADSGTEDEAS